MSAVAPRTLAGPAAAGRAGRQGAGEAEPHERSTRSDDRAPRARAAGSGHRDRLAIGTRRGAVVPARDAALARDAAHARDGAPGTVGEAAAEGAAQGARIGGLVGNAAIGLMMIRKGLQGPASIPRTTWFGKALPWMGVVFSGLGTISATRNLVGALQEPTPQVRKIATHSIDLAGNLLVAGGSIAVLAGAVAAPALIATGAGFLLTTAAGFMAE